MNTNGRTLLNWDANFPHPASLCQSMRLPPPCRPTTHFTAAPRALSSKVSKRQDYLHSSGQRDVSAHVYNLLTMYLEQEYHRFPQWMHLRKIHVLASFNFAAVMVARECHGFTNPCGLVLRVTEDAGTGCEFATLTQPVPTTRVDGSCGICRSV